MRFRATMKVAALPLVMLASPASLTAQMSTPEMPVMPPEIPAPPALPETPATPVVPADPANPAMPSPPPPSGVGAMEHGGIRWVPLAQVSPPAPQAAYPPCTREVQDQCANTHKGTDTPRTKRPQRP